MRIRKRTGFVLALLLAIAPSAEASDRTTVVRDGTALLEEIAANPESGIPPVKLQEAQGLLIIPNMVDTRFVFGKRQGHGVYVPRREDGEWGEPEPYEMSQHTVGAEVGRDVSDLLVIFRSREMAEEQMSPRASLWIAADLKMALNRTKLKHPAMRQSSDKDIIFYSRHRGILVGVSIGAGRRWRESSAVKRPAKEARPHSKPASDHALAKASSGAAPVQAKVAKTFDTPETARLKAVLARISKRPSAPKGKKDTKVSTASTKIRPTGKVAPPRNATDVKSKESGDGGASGVSHSRIPPPRHFPGTS